jgi:hypothetical protein
MYVYKKTEKCLWTVGFYSPDGKWHPESDYDSTDAAAVRVQRLNGNLGPHRTLEAIINHLESDIPVFAPCCSKWAETSDVFKCSNRNTSSKVCSTCINIYLKLKLEREKIAGIKKVLKEEQE